MTNPFTPSFGRIPPILAGRDFLIGEMAQAFESSGSDPALCTLYIGPRGMGKTALMLHIAHMAEQYGWISASTTAQPGMLEDLFEQTILSSREYANQQDGARLKSIGVAGLFNVEWEYRDPKSGNWRTRMGKLLDELAKADVGLLLTVDEVKASIQEMVHLAIVYQHFVAEGRKVALLMAGLPGHVSGLLSHDSISFLRRAVHQNIGLVSDDDTALAFHETIQQAGKEIEKTALQEAIKAIGGFPYMMQLVGFRSWGASGNNQTITHKHVLDGITRARIDFKNGVLDATFRSLSAQDRLFLLAMLKDDEYSTLTDIAQRMGKTPNYTRTYKTRLIEQGMITELNRGELTFGMPFLREYLEAL